MEALKGVEVSVLMVSVQVKGMKTVELQKVKINLKDMKQCDELKQLKWEWLEKRVGLSRCVSADSS